MPAAFEVSEVVDVADRLRAAAEQTDTALGETFESWVEATADAMREEIPVESGETRDSVTIERDGLSATIGPTNRDEGGRPVGFFINYGAGNRPPDDFIGRTAARAGDLSGQVDVSNVL